MGNHHGHQSTKSESSSAASSHNGSKKNSISRTVSGNDIQEKPSLMLPVEKLAKILEDKSHKQEGVNHGITMQVFIANLFSRYPVFGEKLFNYLHQSSKTKHSYIPTNAFKQQCENYLAIIDDDAVRQRLVKMWAHPSEETSADSLTPEDVTSLLMCTYQISMDHYSEGPQMCLSVHKTLNAVVDSCFHGKKVLSAQYVTHWVEANIPRLLFPLHRFAIHALATAWRTLEEDEPSPAVGKNVFEKIFLNLF
ncbi:unnamed protein product [Acanthoscelides obtectus]|uniref:Uncharacterized protein n=1 Tax=Acanthoscelides obtectus TaxID=200917 RepID=A0A9P0PM84_ACAOB|nr:unnamed protein product [Acanthoscelides obtectus]CAK1662663.1 hypothetical protein AOBTE_LOCUS23258 [Acanthoscelides obtectus]